MAHRCSVLILVIASWMTLAVSAHADMPQDPLVFVQQTNAALYATLDEAPSPARGARLEALVDGLFDFDELARGAVGALGATALNDAQSAEVRKLLRRWISRRYVGRLARARGYVATYDGALALSPQSWRVRLGLRSATDPREPPVQIEYLVRRVLGGFKVSDILTEGASLTKSCHDAFAQLLATSNDGYAALVQRLRATPE